LQEARLKGQERPLAKVHGLWNRNLVGRVIVKPAGAEEVEGLPGVFRVALGAWGVVAGKQVGRIILPGGKVKSPDRILRKDRYRIAA
jgi:hypothetical protein